MTRKQPPKLAKLGIHLCPDCLAVHVTIHEGDGTEIANVALSAETAELVAADLKTKAANARARAADDGIGKAKGSA